MENIIGRTRSVDVRRMPSMGRFYPEDINIIALPLSDKEISMWRADADFDECRQMVYDTISTHVLVFSLSKGDMSVNDILWMDYLWLALFLREASGMGSLPVFVCGDGGGREIVELTTENLMAHPDYYGELTSDANIERGCVLYPFRSKGVLLSFPTLGITMATHVMRDVFVGVGQGIMADAVRTVPIMVGKWKNMTSMSRDEIYKYASTTLGALKDEPLSMWDGLVERKDAMINVGNNLHVRVGGKSKPFEYGFSFAELFGEK